MSSRAFLFPGQGSQAVGMARDLCERCESVRARFAEADEVLGFALSALCFEGPAEQLAQTHITQPAVFVHSVAVGELLAAAGLQPAAVAGHSLGEYSALVAAGVLPFAEALTLVGTRGRLMREAGRARPGTMAAVIGLDDDRVAALCQRAAEVGVAVPANFNAPGQVVVSGERGAVARVSELATQAGARRVVELAVSGAFHSPLMESAAAQMTPLLQAASFARPQVPVLTNVSAAPVENPETLRLHLIEQITRPVRWSATVQRLAAMGIGRALEVGPGGVLRGLVRRTAPKLAVALAGTVEEIAAAKGAK